MIYLDNNATTPVSPDVLAAMLPFWQDNYANPSGPYTFAKRSAIALAKARETVATALQVDPAQVTFTSGGTESINTAFHAACAARPQRRHVVTTAVEHAATLACVQRLERQGMRVTRLPVDEQGALDLDQYRSALTPDTVLVSVMAANNETGVLFPVQQMAQLALAADIFFHCDATQMIGKELFSADHPGFSWVSVSAHKFHGPKGVGVALVRDERLRTGLLVGGDQEYGRRAGTENVAGIVGCGMAAAAILDGVAEMQSRVCELRDGFERDVQARLPRVHIIAAAAPRLPNTSMLCVPGLPSEILIARLDMAGICCSAGSACASGATEPSHVLRAMGIAEEYAIGAVRISLSRYTTPAELCACAQEVVTAVEQGD